MTGNLTRVALTFRAGRNLMKPAASPKSLDIPEGIAARCDGGDQFEKLDNLFRAVIPTPKVEIDKQEAQWKRAQAMKRATREQ